MKTPDYIKPYFLKEEEKDKLNLSLLQNTALETRIKTGKVIPIYSANDPNYLEPDPSLWFDFEAQAEALFKRHWMLNISMPMWHPDKWKRTTINYWPSKYEFWVLLSKIWKWAFITIPACVVANWFTGEENAILSILVDNKVIVTVQDYKSLENDGISSARILASVAYNGSEIVKWEIFASLFSSLFYKEKNILTELTWPWWWPVFKGFDPWRSWWGSHEIRRR